MNWEALGAIGEIVGAIAVVLTLGILAVQIRQNSRTVKATAAQSVLQSLSEALRAAAESPNLTRVMKDGLTEFETLDETDEWRFFLWLFAWFRLVEQAHQHYTVGNIEEGTWAGQVAHLKGNLATPAVARFWTARRSAFSQEFQELVDTQDLSDRMLAAGEALAMFRGDSPPSNAAESSANQAAGE